MKESVTKIVSFGALTLYEDTEKDHFGTLSWSIRKGYPRITVYTDNTKEKKDEFSFDKLITAPMDAIVVNIVMDRLLEAINGKPDTRNSTECYNVKYVDNKPTEEIYLQATIITGKDANGVVYVAAIQEGKQNVKFQLLPREKWHKFRNGSDQVTDKANLSKMFATAYHARLKALMDKHLSDEAVVKEQPPKDTVTSVL